VGIKVHKYLRIPSSKRIEMLKSNISICENTLQHVNNCIECQEAKDEELCPLGQKMFDEFLVSQARCKYLNLIGENADVIF
jgi:prefoldin subunit 5